MNLKDEIILGLKHSLRKKTSILSLILISITCTIVLISFSFKESLHKYWAESVKKLVDYRTYVVSYDTSKYNKKDAIEKLTTYKHVIAVAPTSSYLISMKIKDNTITTSSKNSIYLIGTIDNPINLAMGDNLDSASNDEKAVICAKQFYPYIENMPENYQISKSIDISSKLNDYLYMSFLGSEEEEAFKLVGLYDAKENHFEGNVCYTTFDVVEKLNYKYQYTTFFENNEDGLLFIVIDDIDNNIDVKNEVEEDGFFILSPVLQLNTEFGDKIITTIELILYIMIIILIVAIVLLSKINFKKNTKNYAILKTLGFSNKQVILIYIFELMWLTIGALIITINLYLLSKALIAKYFLAQKIMFYNFEINTSITSMILNIGIILVITSIAAFYHFIKLRKINILSMLVEKNDI